MVLDDSASVFGGDFHERETVLEFAGFVSADEFGYGLGGDVGGVFDLADVGVFGLAHRVELEVVFGLLAFVHVGLDSFPEGVVAVQGLHRHHVLVTLPVVLGHLFYGDSVS